MDHLTKDQRSRNMSQIRSKDTKPEIVARKVLHRKGYRFRLHRSDLPGKPDIVLPKFHTVMFVHGCFWHNHKGCKRANIPKSNKSYWVPKIQRNIQRDKKNVSSLRRNGWSVITLWECQMKNAEKADRILERKVKRYLLKDRM